MPRNASHAALPDADRLKVPTYLVIPSAILRSGIEHSLSHTRFRVVASAPTFAALGARESTDEVPLYLVDATRGHDETLKLLEAERANRHGSRAVVLVESCEPQKVLAAYRAGINGYLTTSISQEALEAYLSLVMTGEFAASSSALGLITGTASPLPSSEPMGAKQPWDGVDRRGRHSLSLREAAILRCLLDGDTNKIIASKCDIVEARVKLHLKSICFKLAVKNRTQAALWARAHLPQVERRKARSA